MDQFLEGHNLPTLTTKRKKHSDSIIPIKEIESIISNLPKQKAPSPDAFTGEFYQSIQKILCLPESSERQKQRDSLPNSFYEASNTKNRQKLYKKTNKKTTHQYL